MANVPNTTTFTFQDVTTSVYGDTATGRNLTAAFTAATGVFDPAYVGGKTNLLNFRNYMSTPPVTYTITIRGRTGTSNDSGYTLKYSVNGGAWQTFGNITTVSCAVQGTITGIASGSTVTFICSALGTGGTVPAGAGIYFGAQTGAICTQNLLCSVSFTITSTVSISVYPYLSGNNWFMCA